ncbi:hypothetical protein OBBRIDRAFT_631044 [Obba rivulosa]|uniref:Uncharacterized protein n=1 Tax=Obba rivulosa TaxID=1052685 RepID=A0A8E2ASW4_9APHY|nr:hypothetical protein OBBRIDRAFT_631044 [Obba rivulosa]
MSEHASVKVGSAVPCAAARHRICTFYCRTLPARCGAGHEAPLIKPECGGKLGCRFLRPIKRHTVCITRCTKRRNAEDTARIERMDSAWSSLSHVGYIQYVPKFSMYSALTRVYSRCTLTLKMHSNSAPHRHAEYRRSDPSLSSACTGLGHLLMPTVSALGNASILDMTSRAHRTQARNKFRSMRNEHFPAGG